MPREGETAVVTTYDDMKEAARDRDPAVRQNVAGNARAPAELLYFLAADPVAGVRRLVAANPSTPPQANTLLANDPDLGVRCALARKMVGEGLAPAERARLWRTGFTVLEALATDQLVRVRRILSGAFKRASDAPRDIVVNLARDREETVAAPVLRHSPVLTEKDLVAIAGDAPPPWARAAIRSRAALVPAVSAALDRADAAAERAERESAPGQPAAPVTMRLRRKGFARALPKVLPKVLPLRRPARAAPPGGAVSAIAAVRAVREADVLPDVEPTLQAVPPAVARARALHCAGQLTQAEIEVAIDAGDRAFVVAALALCAGLPAGLVKRILNAQSARSVTALVWRAGFSMRFAMEVQKRVARIPPREVLHARLGVDFPLTDQQMRDQLALFQP